MTIGGTGGTGSHIRAKSPFSRLDDEKKKGNMSETHLNSNEYASSGDGDMVDGEREPTRTASNRGFV